MLAPNFNFTTKVPGAPVEDPKPGVPIQIKGFQTPSTDRVRQIVEEQLDELKVDIFQDPLLKWCRSIQTSTRRRKSTPN